MIVSGSAILEIEPRKGEAQLRDLLRAGDVWSVPATANAWFHCCEDQAASVIAFIGGREANTSDPGLCNPFADDTQGGSGFHHRLMAQPALDRPWGSLRVVEADAFCDPDALSAALIEVSPSSQTDLHWHLNTAVWSICLEGEGSLTQVPAGISPQTTFLKPGQVGHVPRAEGYYLRNDGQTMLTVLEIFRSDHYHDLSLHEWLAASSVESIAAHLCVDVGMIARLSHAGETQGRLSTRL
ncbi:hypothetical protein AA0535_1404 [Asaia krungthepensis NRIC 0535]|uniref:Cupin type-1 domain-containing protein n=2 Tax=Asaia krungthepensis TaxID=220990 RepID=A0ABQ0Q286_9PROT|nr:hypothetical protein AA0535_1404 [Asaia krungthepensis NRIC 0535]